MLCVAEKKWQVSFLTILALQSALGQLEVFPKELDGIIAEYASPQREIQFRPVISNQSALVFTNNGRRIKKINDNRSWYGAVGTSTFAECSNEWELE